MTESENKGNNGDTDNRGCLSLIIALTGMFLLPALLLTILNNYMKTPVDKIPCFDNVLIIIVLLFLVMSLFFVIGKNLNNSDGLAVVDVDSSETVKPIVGFIGFYLVILLSPLIMALVLVWTIRGFLLRLSGKEEDEKQSFVELEAAAAWLLTVFVLIPPSVLCYYVYKHLIITGIPFSDFIIKTVASYIILIGFETGYLSLFKSPDVILTYDDGDNRPYTTPLHEDALNDRVDTLMELINEDTDLDIIDRSNYTPLMRAVEQKSCKAALFLLEKGADPHISVKKNFSILDQVAQSGAMDLVIPLLEKGVEYHPDSKWGIILFIRALRFERIDVMEELLKRGFDVNHRNKHGRSPLHYAVKEGKYESLAFLLVAGADTILKDYNEKTPIDYAKGKHKEKLKTFLENGCSKQELEDTDYQDNNEQE